MHGSVLHAMIIEYNHFVVNVHTRNITSKCIMVTISRLNQEVLLNRVWVCMDKLARCLGNVSWDVGSLSDCLERQLSCGTYKVQGPVSPCIFISSTNLVLNDSYNVRSNSPPYWPVAHWQIRDKITGNPSFKNKTSRFYNNIFTIKLV